MKFRCGGGGTLEDDHVTQDMAFRYRYNMPQKSLDRLRFTVGTFEYVGLKVDQACGFLFCCESEMEV
jgi:hypothetical protein